MTHFNGAQQKPLADVKQALALTLGRALRPLQTTHLEMLVQISQMAIAALTVAHAFGPGLRMTRSSGAQRMLRADVKLAQTQDLAPSLLQTILSAMLATI